MATGTIRAVASSASTLRDIPFSIATTAWTLNGNYYTATFSSAYVTASSKDFVTYDASLRENATSDINMEKTAGGGSVVFSTRTLPIGTITGTLFSVANQDGKTTMVVEDTVLPIVNGGTGANDVAGARQNLGIYVANDLTTTDEGFILDARQGKVLNDALTTTTNNTNVLKNHFSAGRIGNGATQAIAVGADHELYFLYRSYQPNMLKITNAGAVEVCFGKNESITITASNYIVSIKNNIGWAINYIYMIAGA